LGTRRLDGFRTLVTGGGSGIGRATALLFAREGARVAVLDCDSARCESTRDEIEDAGGEAVAICTDVADHRAVELALADLGRRFDRLDVLVNNAGIAGRKRFERLQDEDWDRVWRTNLQGAVWCTRRALSLLRRATEGASVINVASIEISHHTRKLSAYSASKGALASLSRSLAVELGPEGIRVNYLCPGFIATEMTERYRARWLFRKYLERRTPLGRLGHPEDVARVAVFLASSDSAFVTGAGITVDGGLSLPAL